MSLRAVQARQPQLELGEGEEQEVERGEQFPGDEEARPRRRSSGLAGRSCGRCEELLELAKIPSGQPASGGDTRTAPATSLTATIRTAYAHRQGLLGWTRQDSVGMRTSTRIDVGRRPDPKGLARSLSARDNKPSHTPDAASEQGAVRQPLFAHLGSRSREEPAPPLSGVVLFLLPATSNCLFSWLASDPLLPCACFSL